MTFTTKSAEETAELGKRFGERLKGGEVIALIGDLGGGKTQFTKGVAVALGIIEPVVSPTFTIERTYSSPCHSRKGGNLVLHHFDFYRLLTVDQEIEEEIYDLIDDKKNVVVIEWAYNMEQVLPDNFIEIKFEYIDENKRKIELIPHGKEYIKLFEEIK